MKNKKYIFGLILIIITFLLSTTIYYAIFTIPFFLIGVALVWSSETKKTNKILWTIVPLLLIVPAIWTFQFVYEKLGMALAQKVDFNFPKGFQGKAVVVQNIECGQNIYKIKGREQLNLPENGILLYKGTIESGFINHKYFYVTKSKSKIELPERPYYLDWKENVNTYNHSEVGVWTFTESFATLVPPELEKYTYFELIIASKNTKKRFTEFEYEIKLDSVKYHLMKNCK